MKRTDIINHFIAKYGYTHYLEIGIRTPGDNFDRISAKYKDGVDPKGRCNYPMTSDEFFAQIDPPDRVYHLVFIDGLHEEEQVTKDIDNSLEHLAEGGTIVMHDCNPPTEWHQRPVEQFKGGEPWNGTPWRSFARKRCLRDDLSMWVVDTDWGVGIIRKGSQRLFRPSYAIEQPPGEFEQSIEQGRFSYKLLEDNRKELLNLISPDEFLKLLKKGM